MKKIETYKRIVKILHLPFLSVYMYWMNPGGVEKKHHHDGMEVELVVKGNSISHKKGGLYFRKKGNVHEGINDSKEEIIFLCASIPPETKENTHYLEDK